MAKARHQGRAAELGGPAVAVQMPDVEHEQAWLAAIVGSSFDAIIGNTLDGTVTSWNAAAERMFGYHAAEVIGGSIEIIIPPDRIAERRTAFRRLVQGERLAPFETVRVTKDGRLIDVALSLSPIRDRAGVVIGVSAIAQDISAHKRAEQQLQSSQRQLADFVENVAVGLRWLAADGTILWANQAELDLLGYPRDEYVGHHIARFHADRPVIDDILARLDRGDVDRRRGRLLGDLSVELAETVERRAPLHLDPEVGELAELDGVVDLGEQRLARVETDLGGVDVEGGDELEVPDVVAAELDVHQAGHQIRRIGVAVEVDALHQRAGAVAHAGDGKSDRAHWGSSWRVARSVASDQFVEPGEIVGEGEGVAVAERPEVPVEATGCRRGLGVEAGGELDAAGLEQAQSVDRQAGAGRRRSERRRSGRRRRARRGGRAGGPRRGSVMPYTFFERPPGAVKRGGPGGRRARRPASPTTGPAGRSGRRP